MSIQLWRCAPWPGDPNSTFNEAALLTLVEKNYALSFDVLFTTNPRSPYTPAPAGHCARWPVDTAGSLTPLIQPPAPTRS